MRIKLITLTSIIFAVAFFRWLPHPPNISPVAAMALFGGAYFTDKRLAFIVPFMALLLSDLLIGFHNTMLYVYAGFAITVVIGLQMQRRITAGRVATSTLLASILFFLITNFGAWQMNGLYPGTTDGLMQAYIAGIPFFQYSLIGNIAFTTLMFSGYTLLKYKVAGIESAS